MPKIAIVILNWNGKKHLYEFLPSVVVNSGDAEIIVIDNASTDDSISFLKEHYPEIRIIINDTNYGFAGGYNEGLKHVTADYFILLNSDVEVQPNWISPVISVMEQDPEIAAAQPAIRSFVNQTKYEHAGAAGGFVDRDFYPFCRGRIFSETETDKGQYSSVIPVFWATGACLFVKSKFFNEVGGFDADFFAHMEEIDLCWRLKNKGYKIVCVPESVVFHLGGGTLNYDSPRKTFLNFRNNLFLIHKNYYESSLFFKQVRRMSFDGLAGFRFFVTGKFAHFWAVLKAHFSYYGAIIRLNKKRKVLKANAAHPDKSGRYRRSITIDFFFRKKKKFSDLNSADFYQ